MGNYLTIKQVCEHYQVTRKTVYNWRALKKVESQVDKGLTLIKESDVAMLAKPRVSVSDTDVTRELLIEIRRLHSRIDDLERVITQGKLHGDSSKASTKQGVITQKSTHAAYNNDRKQKVIDKAVSVYVELGKPSGITATELARTAKLDRRSVKKYWNEIVEQA